MHRFQHAPAANWGNFVALCAVGVGVLLSGCNSSVPAAPSPMSGAGDSSNPTRNASSPGVTLPCGDACARDWQVNNVEVYGVCAKGHGYHHQPGKDWIALPPNTAVQPPHGVTITVYPSS